MYCLLPFLMQFLWEGWWSYSKNGTETLKGTYRCRMSFHNGRTTSWPAMFYFVSFQFWFFSSLCILWGLWVICFGIIHWQFCMFSFLCSRRIWSLCGFLQFTGLRYNGIYAIQGDLILLVHLFMINLLKRLDVRLYSHSVLSKEFPTILEQMVQHCCHTAYYSIAVVVRLFSQVALTKTSHRANIKSETLSKIWTISSTVIRHFLIPPSTQKQKTC